MRGVFGFPVVIVLLFVSPAYADFPGRVVIGIVSLASSHSSAGRIEVLVQALAPEQPPAETTPQEQASEYRMLVEQVKKGDLGVDFIKLRAAFFDWANDACNQPNAPNRDAMVQAFEAKDWGTAVELAEIVLGYEFVNRGLHKATANAYKELQRLENERFHTEIVQKLFKALLSSGDGKTPETAFRVYSVREEYDVMRELGYEVSGQALVVGPYGKMDALTGVNADKKTASFYFDFNGSLGSRKSKTCSRE